MWKSGELNEDLAERWGLSFLAFCPLLLCGMGAELDFSNSLIASSTNTSSLLTHWFSESGYPFHFTRYCSLRLLPECRRSRIFSTLYSSNPSTRSGGRRS